MRRGGAFTLVEILIVIVILGVLSAIVVPQFTNATQDAQGGNVVAQLETINSQIDLFRARTNNYPNSGALTGTDWQDMINGGYIKSPPVNPVNGLSTVNADGAPGAGWWWYQDANGNFDLEACEFDNRGTGATAHRPLPGQQAIASH